MKVKQKDTGNYVTVYNEGQGKSDAVLLDVQDDVCEVWYPYLQNPSGGNGLRDLVETSQIVAIGPPVVTCIPLF